MINVGDFDRGQIYLSGGMQFANDLGGQWRIECAGWLKHHKYFPLDITYLDKAYTATYGQMYFIKDRKQHLQYKSNFRRHFVVTDLDLVVKDSDALIIYYDESVRRGAGSTSECQVAFNNNVPIFLVSEYENWEDEVPGWLQSLTTKIFTSFDDLYKYLGDLPYGILKKDRYGNRGVKTQVKVYDYDNEYVEAIVETTAYLCDLCGGVHSKSGEFFVSKVSPMYCLSCVRLVKQTHEQHPDRYEFIVDFLNQKIEPSRDGYLKELTERLDYEDSIREQQKYMEPK